MPKLKLTYFDFHGDITSSLLMTLSGSVTSWSRGFFFRRSTLALAPSRLPLSALQQQVRDP